MTSMTQCADNTEPTSWRDLIAQLTPTQIALLESAELRTTPPSELLDCARDVIKMNAEQAIIDARLAHIQVPTGATADTWNSIRADDGDAIRSLTWGNFDTARAHVIIGGYQDESGAFERGICIRAIGRFQDLDELSVPDVRELIQALRVAAGTLAELEALGRRP